LRAILGVAVVDGTAAAPQPPQEGQRNQLRIVDVDEAGSGHPQRPPDVDGSEEHPPHAALPGGQCAELDSVDDLVLACHSNKLHLDACLGQ